MKGIKKGSISVALKLNSEYTDNLSLAVIESRLNSVFCYKYIDNIILIFDFFSSEIESLFKSLIASLYDDPNAKSSYE